jgi:hypothetical protein
MDRPILALLAAAALLGAGGCSAHLPLARNATPPAPAPAAAAPALAQPPSAPPAAPPASAPTALTAPSPLAPTTPSNLAAVDPGEIRVVMLDLNLAHTLDVCGFPALGSYVRDYTQKRIDSCPNSVERKAALHSVMESTALREQRQAEETRASGDTVLCYASDRLAAIKEMIPIAQRLVARAEKPLDCGDISSAQQ